MLEIIDNFLPSPLFSSLTKKFCSVDMPWYLQHEVSADNDGHIQMTHVIYNYSKPESIYFDLLKPLYFSLNVYSLTRCKVNLLFPTPTIIEHGYHIDIPDSPSNAMSAVLYLNTNNGYTIFEDGKKVESVANRLVKFSNSMPHSGSTNSCDAPYRMVLNIDYIEKGVTK